MKSSICILVLYLLMSLSGILLAQGNEDLFSHMDTSVRMPDFHNSSEELPNLDIFKFKSNAIYIQQVGDFNNLNAYTNSFKSKIDLIQIGNDNVIQLGVNSMFINENVIQKGSQNLFYDISLKKTLLHSANVIQIGNRQRLFWLGSNSISEKMFITMQGNNQTILIRNIN